MSQNFWNAEDTAFLIANYATMTNNELAEHLGRKPKGICEKARVLGLSGTKQPREWSPDDQRRAVLSSKMSEMNISRAAGGRPRSDMTADEIRTAKRESQKRWYRKKRGLEADADLNKGGPNAWTDEQIAFLKANWLKMTEAELAESIGRTRRAVANKGAVLKLPKKSTSGSRPSSRPSHPKPVVKVEATVEQFIAARAKMKTKPGPMSLGWRVRSWR